MKSASSPALPLHHAPPPPPPFPPPSNQPSTASGSTVTVTSRRRRRVNASDRRRYALPTTVTSDGYDYVHDSTGAAVPASYNAYAAETLEDDVESHLSSSPLDGGKMAEAPESPRLLPRPATLSDFCIHDAEYQDVLLRRRRGRVVPLDERSGGGGRRRRNVGLDCARGCAGLSFVGVLFLIFVGILIERQPLYIKGVPLRSGSSLQRWQEQRQMLQQQQQRGRGGKGDKISLGEDLTDNKKKRRTQKNKQRRSYYGAGSGGQQHQQQQEEEGGKWRMRTESCNAFKASAAYFITMVLSLIYIQVQSNDIDLGLGVALQQMTFRLRRYIAQALQSYRRRHYVDIPDKHSTTPAIHVFDQRDGGYQRNFTFELWRRVTRIGGMMGSGDGRKKDR